MMTVRELAAQLQDFADRGLGDYVVAVPTDRNTSAHAPVEGIGFDPYTGPGSLPTHVVLVHNWDRIERFVREDGTF